jgi:hypothetical protein
MICEMNESFLKIALAPMILYPDVANSLLSVSQRQETTNKLSTHWHYSLLIMQCILARRNQRKCFDVSGSLNGALLLRSSLLETRDTLAS